MMPADLQDIIQRTRNGDLAAFKTLVTMYQQTAYRLSFRILGNDEEARDTVQESFIRIWEKISTYNPEKNFTTWVYRIIVNSSIDRFRSIRRRNQVSLEKVPEFMKCTSTENAELSLSNKDLVRLIRLIAGGLPEKQRLTFLLRDIEGLDSKEVEQILGIPETSVKSNLWHARRAIRERLSEMISYERNRR